MTAGATPVPPPGRGAIARRLRAELGSPPSRADWPPVSIVILNRDGEEHLRLLLPRLAEATDYPQLELILVDNGSRDSSVEYARSVDLPFPLTVVENEENVSFSDANDDGVERAGFDRVLLLNNDVEPFEPYWLKELVACLEESEANAAGATLLHGEEDAGREEYIVQHAGLELVRDHGFVAPANTGDGRPLEPLGNDHSVPALTAACLLVRRHAFERAGGFTTGFLWGWEDVDLGLKLGSGGGALLCSGRSVLFHRESSTRSRADREWQRRTKASNRRLFMERWGPQVRREYMLDRLSAGGFWTDGRPLHLAVGLSADQSGDVSARKLSDAVEDRGWRVTLLEPNRDGWSGIPEDIDFVLATDPAIGASVPAGVGCVAWVREGPEEWLGSPLLRRAELTLAADLGTARSLEAAGVSAELLSGEADADRLVELLRGRAQRLRFCLDLSRSWDLEPAALALRRSLELRGHACSFQLADEWDLLDGATADVVVALGDPGEYCTRPAQVNVLWTTGGLRPTRCDQWDLVLVPDEPAAAALAPETPTPVATLDLRADADAADALLERVAEVVAAAGVQSRVPAERVA